MEKLQSHKIHLPPENDTLWRNWFPDDGYFDNSGSATSVPPLSGKPNYGGNVRESISEYTAPTLVYQTAKVAKPMNTSGNFNLNWSFNVDKSAGHLVRVHFCDIISESPNTLNFSLHIYNNFSMLINPYECRKPKSIETSDWSPLTGGGSSHSRMTEGTIPNMNLGLKIPFSEIQLATKNFDTKLRIEVLCARPAIDSTLPREQANLAEWAMLCKNKGLLEDIIDPSLKDQIDPNSLRKFIETTEKCLQECGTDRPTMGDILWDLEYALQLQQTAMPREPHEDSTVGGSAALTMPNVWRFPSISMSIERDDMPAIMDDGSYTRDSEVLSQLKADGSR
ncbi:hypothetical protein CMV_005159 [Castanea mollissima]|uniref:Malectin-like domain-containing protein n=1 Tax=Castanea mollissima TaxID=60419 RepID=A0A8J4RXX2_9ROSI|nr:hypothetical protein CMV_005159 [Castanea mollissima]